MSFILLLSGLFLGWSLGANDAGNIFGAAVETRMLKFKTAALIASIFVILGAILQGQGSALTLNRLGSVNALAGSFTVALAAAVSLIVMVRLHIPVSSSQAVVGAILGWNLFTGAFTDTGVLIQIVSAWVITPILSAFFTIILFYSFQYYLNHKPVHLLHLDYFTRLGLVIVGAFGSFSLGANNIANVMGMFVDSTPFKDIFFIYGITISGVTQLFFIGALAIAVGIFTYSQKNMKTVGHDLFKLSPLTGLIVVLSSSLVLFLFASKTFGDFLHLLHLPTLPLVPVSSSQAVIGAIVGLSLTKGIKNIHYKVLGKISIGWIINPVFAGLICFVSLFIVQNVFDQIVYQPSTHRFESAVMYKLQNEQVNINRLSIINGKTYKSSSDLKKELLKINLSNPEKQKISEISKIYAISLNDDKLYKKLDRSLFTDAQIKELKALKRNVFLHKWQLQDTLQQYSGDWRFKSKSLKNNYYNRELQQKYEILFKVFHISNI